MADPANPRDRQGSQDIEMQPLPPNPAADSAHDTLGTVPPDDNDQGQNPPADGDGLGPNAPRNQGPNPRRGRRGGNRGDAVDRIDQFNDGVRRLNRKTVMYCIIIWVLVAAIIVLFIALHETGVLGGKYSSEPAAKNSTLDANSTSEANLTSPKLMVCFPKARVTCARKDGLIQKIFFHPADSSFRIRTMHHHCTLSPISSIIRLDKTYTIVTDGTSLTSRFSSLQQSRQISFRAFRHLKTGLQKMVHRNPARVLYAGLIRLKASPLKKPIPSLEKSRFPLLMNVFVV